MTGLKVEFPRRQAMLSIWGKYVDHHGEWKTDTSTEVARVPVFVWPNPTYDGCFIVEHQDGHCQKVQPYELTFLDSKELFDLYGWQEQDCRRIEVSEGSLVRHMVEASGKTQSEVSEAMGKSRGYVLATTSRESSPSATNLAKLARACWYRFVLEGHGESISVIDNDD